MRLLQGSPFSIGQLAAVVLVACLVACQPAENPADTPKPWVGKWIAVGAVSDTEGELTISGVYHYYANRTFASQISFKDRPALEEDPSDPNEYKSLFDTYRAGFGTYSVNASEDTLTYEYSSNMRTHRIASPTSFQFTVAGDTMHVTYEMVKIILARE